MRWTQLKAIKQCCSEKISLHFLNIFKKISYVKVIPYLPYQH